MQKSDAIWLAGVLDGRGTLVRTNNGHGGHYPRISLAGKDRELIEEAARAAGCGAIDAIELNGSPAWRWRTSRAETKFVAMAVLPYMRLRRREMQSLLDATA